MKAKENMKKVMKSPFGDECKRKMPTLDDYTTIKSYEDACVALGEQVACFDESLPKHIIALMKLETISRALWGRDFEPKPDVDSSKRYYSLWFWLFTESEINRLSEEERGTLLSATANTGVCAGFGSLYTHPRSSHTLALSGFRLCQETAEKAEYFGNQFVELWAEYLAYNFTVGERLK